VGALGAAAATPEFLAALAQVLREGQLNLRVLQSITKIGIRFVVRRDDIVPEWVSDLAQISEA
jgi:hypothetical protein